MGCDYNKWYSLLSEEFPKCLIKSSMVSLPSSFIDYLRTDGIVIPSSSKVSNLFADQLSDDEDIIEVEAETTNTAPVFKELDKQINDSIAQLGGKVFVKLNWSSPTDSAWINGGSLACTTAGDVYLLLKASEKISSSIDHMFDNCVPQNRRHPESFVLVLKKWANMHPAMGFRCFIHKKQLKGGC
eukprot:gene2610-5103_t